MPVETAERSALFFDALEIATEEELAVDTGEIAVSPDEAEVDVTEDRLDGG